MPGERAGLLRAGAPVEPGSPTSWADYLALFGAVRSQRAVGEATTSYLATPGTAKRIRDRLPHARILMVLRDPVYGLFAYYVAARVAGASSSFRAWVEAERTKESARKPIFGVVWEGRYATHLRQYREASPGRSCIWSGTSAQRRPRAPYGTAMPAFLTCAPTYLSRRARV